MPSPKKDWTPAVLFATVTLLLGLTAALFWLGRPREFSRQAASLDAALTALLRGRGAAAEDVAPLRGEDRKAGSVSWKEYRRSVRLPAGTDRGALLGDLQKAGAENGATVSLLSPGTSSWFILAEIEGRRVAGIEVGLIPPRKTPARRVALVIDDVGYTPDISAFTELGVPITFALLPRERHTKEIAAGLSAQKRPFILHLPLEPERYPAVDPGGAALLLRMNEEEMRRQFMTDLSSVPGVCGVSNHMGSAFSEDEEKMRFLLSLVKENGLFYFDSYTTPKTTARKAARATGVPFAENELFLDLKDDHEFMKKQCQVLLKKVKRYGAGIAIAHVQKKHIVPVLREIIPEFRKEGVEFVYLTDMVGAVPRAVAKKGGA